MTHEEQRSLTQGFFFGVAAFVLWGIGPVYFKAVAEVTPAEVLAHRIIWSVLFLLIPLATSGSWRKLSVLLRNRQMIGGLFITALLIGVNWLTFIYAVSNDQILGASLGYFILPIFNLLLARLFFSERLMPLQYLAVLLAILGVINQIYSFGQLPWIALTLAVTFGFYGVIRKKHTVDPVVGLAVETLLLFPFALMYLGWLWSKGALMFAHSGLAMDLLLILAGIVSSLPLIFFAASVNRLSYSTVAVMQYIAPSITFLLGVIVYHEPFGSDQMVTFGLIWCALGIFSWEGSARHRRLKAQVMA